MTATPTPASVESVMALYNEAEDAASDAAHELSGPQEMARLQNARDRFRAEVERLAAQAAPTGPARNRTPGFDASTPTGRPSRDWYAAVIHRTIDDDFTIGPDAAAQPPQAPTVQAVQATPTVRMLTLEEMEEVGPLNRVALLRKFCAVNAGRTIPADGKIVGA